MIKYILLAAGALFGAGCAMAADQPNVVLILLHANKSGEVMENVYSWDDANPSAKNEGPIFLTNGTQSSVKITFAE